MKNIGGRTFIKKLKKIMEIFVVDKTWIHRVWLFSYGFLILIALLCMNKLLTIQGRILTTLCFSAIVTPRIGQKILLDLD